MKDHEKTREQLISELAELRGRVAACHESEARVRCLFETVPLGVTECDTGSVITLVNPAFANMTGYSSKELVGMRVADLVQEGPQREAFLEYLKYLVLEQPTPSPYRCTDVTKDGRVIDVQVDWTYNRNSQGQVTGFISIVSDITERKRAEEALQASEERFRKIFEEGPMGVALVGLDARIQHVNRRFCEMLGYSEEEIIALGIRGITHPDDGDADRQMGMRLLRGEIPSYAIEKRYVRKNGQAIWGQLITSMICDAQGQPRAVIGMIEDITERKQAEEALKKNKAILQAAIECLPFEFFAIGPDGRYILQNAIARQHHGDSIGKCPEECALDEKTRQVWLDNNRRAFAGERVEGEVEACLVGDNRHYYNIITPIRDGGQIDGILGVNVDITSLKRATEALRESEERYRMLAEAIPYPVWHCEANGDVIECNRRWYEYTGQTPEEAKGNGWMKALHPDDVAQTAQKVRDDVAGERIYQTEYRLCRASDGSYRWHLARAIPRRDGNGTIVDWFGCAANIHDQKVAQEALERQVQQRTIELRTANEQLQQRVEDRKRAEEALRQSHAQLQTIHDNIVEGLLITDIETKRIRRVNPSFCRMLGYDEEELLTKSIPDLHPAEEVLNDLARFQATAEGRVSINEDRPVLRRDGSIFYADITGHPILYEGRPCLLALFRDISERKEAEEALRRSHDELRTIYDGLVDGLLIADIETKRFVRTNDAICRMLGYTNDELLVISVQDIHPPEQVQSCVDAFHALVEERIDVASCIPMLRKDGMVFYADIVGRKLIYAQRPCIIGIFRDITERKRAQEALGQRTALADWRASQLQRLAAKLTQTEERERRHLAQVLHDHLQQILVAAKLEVGRTLSQTKGSKLGAGVERVQNLLDEAIRESRSLTAELSPPVLYDRGLAAGLEWLGRQAQEKFHLTVSVEADPAADLKGDSIGVLLFQATRELILNATKHAHASHVGISLSRLGEEHILLVVSDDGDGCDREALSRRSDTGGFGLFSIQERLDLIGGELEIQSAPGKGMTVTITAPYRGAQAKEPKLASERFVLPDLPSSAGGRLRIVLADDHPLLRKGLADMLLDQPGLDLIGEAGDGQEALEMALQLQPDVILMDVSMPRMDGIEATRRIKEAAPEIRIIGLSMHERGDMETTMREAGADDYLVKSAAAEDLISAILNLRLQT